MSTAREKVGVRVVGALALVILGAACRGIPDPALVQLSEARRLAAETHVLMAKASGASDRAVMANTDEESQSFAKEAEQSLAAIEGTVARLADRLAHLDHPDESRALEDFRGHFAEYRRIDRDVLTLAIQNTNLKAQRLSFGPVRAAADGFAKALDEIVAAAPVRDRSRVEAAAARAQLAVREIQVMQAPHIAEADDAVMTKIEGQMASRQAAASAALVQVRALAGESAAAPLAAAGAALDRFRHLSAELVALSRRNSNVVSLAISLRKKPAVTAACDQALGTLENLLLRNLVGGTR